MRYTTLILIIAFAIGCGGNDPASVNTPDVVASADSRIINDGHSLWGLWNVRIEADGSELDIAPLRHTQLHLNALDFLEPPVNNLLKIEGAWIDGGILNVEIGLRHPMYGQTQFTGFDVKGIVILPGSDSCFTCDDIIMPGEGETRLVNPDGLTKWWNPREFPPNESQPIFGYKDGILGTPDSTAEFASTLNAYKYFADGLGPVSLLSSLDTSKRGMFGSSSHNSRRYKFLVSGDVLTFNYAVDASWAKPAHVPPTSVPGDFPLWANQPEPYSVVAETFENTLYFDGEYGGGDLTLDVTVRTWRDISSIKQVTMEASGAFGPVGSTEPVESGEGWAKYRLHAYAGCPRKTGSLDVLLRAETSLLPDYGGYLKCTLPAGFGMHTVEVDNTAPGGPAGSVRGFRPGEAEDVDEPWMMLIPVTMQGLASNGNHMAYVYPCDTDGSSSKYALLESHSGGHTFSHKQMLNAPCTDDGDSTQSIIDPQGTIHTFMTGYLPSPNYFILHYMRRLATETEFYDPIGVIPKDDIHYMNGSRFVVIRSESGRLNILTDGWSPRYLYYTYTDNFEDFSEPVIVGGDGETAIGGPGVGNRVADMAVTSGDRLNIVWAAYGETSSMANIFFTSGFPGSMSPTIEISNGPPAARACPSILVDDMGIIHVFWLDGRDNQYPDDWGPDRHYEVYYAYSIDGGQSFSENMRMTYEGPNREIFRLISDFDGGGNPVVSYYVQYVNPYDLIMCYVDFTIREIAIDLVSQTATSPVDIMNCHDVVAPPFGSWSIIASLSSAQNSSNEAVYLYGRYGVQPLLKTISKRIYY